MKIILKRLLLTITYHADGEKREDDERFDQLAKSEQITFFGDGHKLFSIGGEDEN